MIDVRVANQVILEEREIAGSPLDLMCEVVTIAGLILGRVSKDEETHTVMKNALSETIKRLEYGNIREKE